MALARSARGFLRDLRREWKDDHVSDIAGMVTFQGVLAIFPFLLFLVALASVLIDPARAAALVDQLSRVAPPEVAKILGDRLHALSANNRPGLLTVSAVFAIWSASGGVRALIRALNATYGVREGRPAWKVLLLSIGMTLFGAAFALAAALVAIAAPSIANSIGGPIGTVMLWLRLPLAALLAIFLFACLYYFLPDVEHKFKFISPGSVVSVALWLIASWAFSVYVGNFGRYDVIYGALGGVIVMLVWMWISAQALLLGAEINSVIAHRSIRRRLEERPAT